MRRERRNGFTLIEVVMATSILLVILMALPTPIFSLYRTLNTNQDKAFAAQKATQMVEELRALVQGGGETAILNLDKFDDAGGYKTVLTTEPNVVRPPAPAQANPADPLSGNVWLGGRWKFLRQVAVRRTTTPGSRLVTVRLSYSDAAAPDRPAGALAEVSTVLQSQIDQNIPSQVYDIFALALDNVPGWWSDLSYLKPIFNTTATDMATRNPGFQPRVHYVTRLSYGRDPYYAPYINVTSAAANDPNLQWAYLYPGLIRNRALSPVGNAFYYVPDDIQADGYRVLADGTMRNGYASDAGGIVTQGSFSLADQFNHAVRYPEEMAIYNRLRQEARNAGKPDPDPTLRLLLERLHDTANRPYRNGLIVNLHGELQPLVPLRNYADGARDPAGLPGIRLVSHPEQIGYNAGDVVRLRVYAWRSNANNALLAPSVPVSTIFIPTSQPVPAADTVAASLAVQKVYNDPANLVAGYQVRAANRMPSTTPLPPAAPAVPAAGPGDWPIPGIDYRIDTNPVFDDNGDGTPETHNGILITLFNTPTTTPFHAASRTGLDPAERLYGLEYVPSPIQGFGRHLATADAAGGPNRPKNTARWLLQLDAAALGLAGPIAFETRIGNDLATGVRPDGTANGHALASLANLSRTYSWVGTPVPATERYQVLGDPRHNPYLDVQAVHRYNWYFDSPTAGHLAYVDPADYPDLPRLKSQQWDGDDYDVAALLGLWRDGLMASDATYTTMTGYSFYYAGLGGEIGTSGTRTKFDVAGYPWDMGATPRSAVEGEAGNEANEIVAAGRLVARTDLAWFAMPWLGELAPDDAFASWSASGNLPAPQAAGTANSTTYFRASWNAAFAAGTLGGPRRKRLNVNGCASFFNGSGTTRSARFDHYYKDGTYAPLSNALGADLSQAFNLPLPTTIDSYRPFSVATTAGGAGSTFPPEWNEAEFASRGTVLTYLDTSTAVSDQSTYYKHNSSGMTGSAAVIVKPAGGSSASGRAHVVINGLAPQGDTGGSFMARYALSSLLQTFLATGDYVTTVDDPNRTVQLPRVEIQFPKDGAELTDPSTLVLSWSSSWKRWDNRSYIAGVPAGWAELASLQYQVLYSADNGKSWRFAADGAAASPGVYDSARATAATSASFYVGALPRGSYLFRVEAYRQGNALHYAYHQSEVYLNRQGG